MMRYLWDKSEQPSEFAGDYWHAFRIEVQYDDGKFGYERYKIIDAYTE